MKPNPPIKGHRLIHEGHVWRGPIWPDEDNYYWQGGCECGDRPDGFPDVSVNAMKRWHRQHKAELRGET